MNQLLSIEKGPDQRSQRWFYVLCAVSAILIFAGIKFDLLLPAIALPLAYMLVFWLIFRLDLVIWLIVLVTPLSINLAHTSIGIGVSLPSEPLLFGVFLLYWLTTLLKGGLPREIVRHPVTLLIFLHMAWFLVTTATSSMPVVSIKSTLARFCYISVFYFAALQLFSKLNNIVRFVWLYTIPLLVVIAYTLANQYAAGFSQDNAHTAMVPFYNDHTAYASVLCFFIPILFAFSFEKKLAGVSRGTSFLVLSILIAAVILSYTRAAWIGLVVAFACYLVFQLRIHRWIVYGGIALLVLLLLAFRVDIALKLENNNKVSSTDYSSHVQSIGNISTDDSNVERLNRWACAMRMFREKPFFGWGPGTYMFKYAPFQKTSEKSGISTNAGTGGGSHSEYLGPLSEQGVFGLCTFVLIGIACIVRASKFIRLSQNKGHRAMAKGLLLGLVTYWIHGFLNYFLDTEKASIPFWAFVAALVALELYSKSDLTANQPATQQGNVID